MKNLFFALLAAILLLSCTKEGPAENNDPNGNDTPGDTISTLFDIEIDNGAVTPWSVAFDILPEEKERMYYYNIASKTNWSSIDIQAIKDDVQSSAEGLSEMTGTPVEEVLASILTTGDVLDFYSDAGYRPETDYVIYAFYWDDESQNVEVAEFTTKSANESAETLDIFFENVDSYSIEVRCTPSAGVAKYYYYFERSEIVEEMLASLEDSQAYISYHAMNVGIPYQGEQLIAQQALAPDTEYTALVMAEDENGDRFVVSQEQMTPAVSDIPRVESELFTALLGEYAGVQTVTDLYNEPFTSEFTVTIAASLDDYDYDYRACNQLVALVDGWNQIPYYSVQGLIDEGIEDPELKFGPKWLLNIAEGDIVSIDGQARNSVIGWQYWGDCYMFNAEYQNSVIHTDSDLVVEISEDLNTITIKSPEHLSDAYPSLAYQFTGIGWMGYFFGTTDIVLTRK